MSRTRGIVAKTGKGQYSYYITLDGDERYYNTKFEPKCNPGDDVGIEFEDKGPRRANIKKVVVLQAGARPAPAPSSGSGYSAPAGGDRQASIIWQHSQEIAVRLVTAMLQSGALSLPKTDPETVLLAKYDELTVRAYNDAADPLNSDTYKAAQAAADDFAGADDTSSVGNWGDSDNVDAGNASDDWDSDWSK